MKIITISREFGSGGRELGKRLADHLGFAYYDKEIVAQLARNLQMNPDYLEKVLDQSYISHYPHTFQRSFALMPPTYTTQPKLIAEQTKIIRELAQKGDCIFVGRAADALLRAENPFRMFVYAETPAKLDRCRQRAKPGEDLSDREMLQRMRRIDKDRAANYGLIADYPWGDRRAYHLCVNTTGLEIPKIVPHVAAYAEMFFGE